MRAYSDKQNVQKKAYYSDRFRIQPSLPRQKVESDEGFSQDLQEFAKEFEIAKSYIEAEQLVIWIDPKDIKKALHVIKNNGYENLSEMSAVDFLAQKEGFEVFYQLLSMKKRKRLRVKCFIKQGETIDSVESIYKSANWSEREMYDMFGILVNNHPCMKRLLMPDDWHGHPLLKTYPLHGDEAARWYEVDKLFGKEYREVVGEEQRDSALISEDDTKNFSRIFHEVPYSTPPSKEPTNSEYQEENGVFIVTKVKKEDSKTIEGRR